VCDAEAPPFCVTYEGCHVVNPGAVLGCELPGVTRRRGGVARWVEYDFGRRRREVRELRF